uniref:Uncharacterized protein n=1 Tax=Lepeophtheirus salmonis TaxID=72036 RepID=A0A0K2VHH2_LEPSM
MHRTTVYRGRGLFTTTLVLDLRNILIECTMVPYSSTNRL